MRNERQEIICNCCKKVIGKKGEIPNTEFLHVAKQWGYFSGKDGEQQEFDICEACYDAWTASFPIPVTRKEMTELI